MKRQGPGLPAVQTDFFVPAGGLDEITPPLQLSDGACRAMQNFEQGIRGGYRRIKGYERFTGRIPTAEMRFSIVTLQLGASGSGASPASVNIPAWATMVGNDSGATATLIGPTLGEPPTPGAPGPIFFGVSTTGGAGFYVQDQKGSFITGEAVLFNGIFVGSGALVVRVASIIPEYLYGDFLSDPETKHSIETKARASQFAPGLGLQQFKLLGVSEIDGVPYLAGLQWLGESCYFGIWTLSESSGGSPLFAYREWSRLTGTTTDNLVYSTPGTPTTNFTGWPPTYCEMVPYNFTGAAYAKKLYGVTGVGKAFAFNPGTGTLSYIATGMAVDTPTRLAAHKNRLFLAFGASVQYSAAGDPTTWTPVLGAGEIAMGEFVTQMGTVVGSDAASALLIGAKKGISILYGDAAADFRLVQVNRDMGLFPGTLQVMADPVFMNEYGVTTLGATRSFGNFQTATISQQVQKFINARRGLVTCSVLVRGSNQYRIFFSDKTGLYFTFKGNKLAAVTPVRFNHVVRSAVTYQDAALGEVILFTSDDNVYRMDVGRNFEGKPIDAFALLSFNHMKSPRLRKAFRRISLEVEAESGYVKFQAGVDVDHSGPSAKQTPEQEVDGSSSTVWDEGAWDDLAWDASGSSPASISIDGTGKNVSLFIRCADMYVDPFTITGVMTHWVARRLER